MKLNVTHQILVYGDDVNILGGNVHTIKKDAEALAVASKETEIEVNADKISTWSCLEIRMQDKVVVYRLIIVPVKGWKCLSIW